MGTQSARWPLPPTSCSLPQSSQPASNSLAPRRASSQAAAWGPVPKQPVTCHAGHPGGLFRPAQAEPGHCSCCCSASHETAPRVLATLLGRTPLATGPGLQLCASGLWCQLPPASWQETTRTRTEPLTGTTTTCGSPQEKASLWLPKGWPLRPPKLMRTTSPVERDSELGGWTQKSETGAVHSTQLRTRTHGGI